MNDTNIILWVRKIREAVNEAKGRIQCISDQIEASSLLVTEARTLKEREMKIDYTPKCVEGKEIIFEAASRALKASKKDMDKAIIHASVSHLRSALTHMQMLRADMGGMRDLGDQIASELEKPDDQSL